MRMLNRQPGRTVIVGCTSSWRSMILPAMRLVVSLAPPAMSSRSCSPTSSVWPNPLLSPSASSPPMATAVLMPPARASLSQW